MRRDHVAQRAYCRRGMLPASWVTGKAHHRAEGWWSCRRRCAPIRATVLRLGAPRTFTLAQHMRTPLRCGHGRRCRELEHVRPLRRSRRGDHVRVARAPRPAAPIGTASSPPVPDRNLDRRSARRPADVVLDENRSHLFAAARARADQHCRCTSNFSEEATPAGRLVHEEEACGFKAKRDARCRPACAGPLGQLSRPGGSSEVGCT